MKCIGPKAKDADLWMLNWEEVRRIHPEGILLEVEHVHARRSKKKEKQEMSLFDNFVTEGNERAGCVGKKRKSNGGWRRHGAQIGASTVQPKREKRFTRPCSVQPAFTVWWRSATLVKSSNRSRKKSSFFVNTKRGSQEASFGLVCGREHKTAV